MKAQHYWQCFCCFFLCYCALTCITSLHQPRKITSTHTHTLTQNNCLCSHCCRKSCNAITAQQHSSAVFAVIIAIFYSAAVQLQFWHTHACLHCCSVTGRRQRHTLTFIWDLRVCYSHLTLKTCIDINAFVSLSVLRSLLRLHCMCFFNSNLQLHFTLTIFLDKYVYIQIYVRMYSVTQCICMCHSYSSRFA